MTSKPKAKGTTFLCQDCGHTSPRWEGRCPECGGWGTYVEYREPKAATAKGVRSPAIRAAAVPGLLSEQPVSSGARLNTGFSEVDSLLGGGVVPGSLLLMAGDPGIGKSTLLLQMAAGLAAAGRQVLYVSGEESGSQVRIRADRLGVTGAPLLFLGETDLAAVLEHLQQLQPAVAIVDSIQTLASEQAASAAGSVAQVRECAQALLAWAKSSGTAVLLAGHVTKDGSIAGPRVLEHMVDVVLYMEGEAMSSYRVLRCTKNRFGSTNDLALLEMRGDGLAEVKDPSAALIAERQAAVPGSAVIVTLEGSRPLLCEVQALTNYSSFTPPRRTATGIDFNRMAMLAAVLARRAGISLGDQDLMVNLPGGLRVSEPAADLGVALAIASSFRDKPLDPTAVFLGEVGLNGEVRRVPQIDRRLQEAARHGFQRAYVPAGNGAEVEGPPGLDLVRVDSVRSAAQRALAEAAAKGGLPHQGGQPG